MDEFVKPKPPTNPNVGQGKVNTGDAIPQIRPANQRKPPTTVKPVKQPPKPSTTIKPTNKPKGPAIRPSNKPTIRNPTNFAVQQPKPEKGGGGGHGPSMGTTIGGIIGGGIGLGGLATGAAIASGAGAGGAGAGAGAGGIGGAAAVSETTGLLGASDTGYGAMGDGSFLDDPATEGFGEEEGGEMETNIDADDDEDTLWQNPRFHDQRACNIDRDWETSISHCSISRVRSS